MTALRGTRRATRPKPQRSARRIRSQTAANAEIAIRLGSIGSKARGEFALDGWHWGFIPSPFGVDARNARRCVSFMSHSRMRRKASPRVERSSGPEWLCRRLGRLASSTPGRPTTRGGHVHGHAMVKRLGHGEGFSREEERRVSAALRERARSETRNGSLRALGIRFGKERAAAPISRCAGSATPNSPRRLGAPRSPTPRPRRDLRPAGSGVDRRAPVRA